MKTYYLPMGFKIFMCICAVGSFVFGIPLTLRYIEIVQTAESPAIAVVCLLLILFALLLIGIYALHFIFTGKIKSPYCHISEQGFQFSRGAIIPWSQIEKVVFVKSLLGKEGWDEAWGYAYLVLRPKGTKRCILSLRGYPDFFGFGAVLSDMKREFTKYIPVEIK